MRQLAVMAAIVAALVFVALLCGVTALEHTRRAAMSARGPLQLEELGLPPVPDAPSQPAPQAEVVPAPAIPRRPALVRAVKPEEVPELRGSPRSPGLEARVKFGVGDALATALWAVGSDAAGGWYWETGQEAARMGNFGTARNYYREALRYPLSPYQREWCLARLAWLEPDARVADRMMEEACASGNSHWLYEGAKLAQVTGSDALRDHYLRRLRGSDPEYAKWAEGELARAAEAERPD